MSGPDEHELPVDSDGQPCGYTNHYECSRCGTTWSDCWSCACNDRCPGCDVETEPYDSDLTGIESIRFAGPDFLLSSQDISDSLLNALLDCGVSGDASEAVAYVRQSFAVTGEAGQCAAMLRGYGAWDEIRAGRSRGQS